MAIQNKNSVPVFNVQKKHAWRDVLLRFVSLILIGSVVLGTLVWLLVVSGFSFQKFLNMSLEALKPQVQQEKKVDGLTPEEELRVLIDQDKLFEIESLTKTAEGDFVVVAKNGPTVIFTVKKSLTDQLTTLQTLLTKAKIDNKALKKVDFRFAKIVVEY
jgi:hypothetical protein